MLKNGSCIVLHIQPGQNDQGQDSNGEAWREDSSSNQPLHPDATKVLACVVIVAFVTAEVAMNTGW